MYRKLLATTALSLVLAGGAYAQDAVPPADLPLDPAPTEMAPAPEAEGEALTTAAESGINSDGWLASEVTGSTIYTSAAEDAEAIGDVNDFVLDEQGQVAAVIVGVGGFLGIGEKNVAINWEDLELTVDTDGEQRLTSTMTREQLEAAAEFDRAEWLASENAAEGDALVDDGAMAPAPMAPAPIVEDDAMVEEDAAVEGAPIVEDDAMMEDDAAAEAEVIVEDDAMMEDDAAAEAEVIVEDDAMMEDEAAVQDDAAAVPLTTEVVPADEVVVEEEAVVQEPMVQDDAAAAPVTNNAIDQQLEMVDTGEVSAEDLNGTSVYGANDEEIGSIGDIILTQDGAVEAVIIDFGGFLGIGTKPVAISYQNLEFYRDAGDTLILRTALTAEQLEAAPEYDETTYADAPNDQLVTLE